MDRERGRSQAVRLAFQFASNNATTDFGWYVDDIEVLGAIPVTVGDPLFPSGASRPVSFAVRGNVPNPFRTATTIRFDLPEPARVTIRLYDVSGRLIEELLDSPQPAGFHRLAWMPTPGTAAGVYYYRVQAGSHTATEKLLLLR